MKKINKSLNIAWLYPELMSTYGDRGNIIVLQKRAEWRGVRTTVIRINEKTHESFLQKADILFMGGAQDIQQEIVQKDLNGPKGKLIVSMIENATPSLFICGAYQFLGKYYIDSYGTEIPGLGIFDMFTKSFKSRLIGNVIAKPHNIPTLTKNSQFLTGFENHGGRTYLSKPELSFATVIKGNGNNGEDQTEGIHYKSTIGTYLHGPILPANPLLADYLLEKALAKKYGAEHRLEKLDDLFAEKAKLKILDRLSNH